MRVLLISYLFPPFNTIGAVRTGKTAAYLTRFGHDVRVLTAANQPLEPSLALEIPDSNVTSTGWLNVNWPVELALGGRSKVAARGFTLSRGRHRGLLGALGGWSKTLLNFPDGQIGWLPFAVRAANQICRHWRPDVILGSALPMTSLLVA